MRRPVILVNLALLLLAVAGCNSDSYGAVMRDTLVQLERFYSACKKASQHTQVSSILGDVKSVHEELKKLKERLNRLPPETAAVTARVDEKYYAVVTAIVQRLDTEVRRLQPANEQSLADTLNFVKENLMPKKI